MSSDALRPEQAERLKDLVGRQLRFLNRLQGRMNRLRFPTDDPLWLGVVYARNAARGGGARAGDGGGEGAGSVRGVSLRRAGH